VIIPDSKFPSTDSKRSIDIAYLADIMRRSPTLSLNVASRPGDKPWFCWWNSTFLEFFLYMNETPAVSPTSRPLSYIPSTTLRSAAAAPFLPSPSLPAKDDDDDASD